MASKLPPRSTTTTSRITSLDRPAQPSQPSNPLTNTAIRASETYKRRRSVFWAVGIAVIVASGAIIGAQLNELQQKRQNKQEQKPIAQDVTEKVQVDKRAETPNNTVSTSAVGPTKIDARGASYNQRQIAILEDRRGVLMKQKFDLEMKLERVREKRKREEMVEERRSIGVGSER